MALLAVATLSTSADAQSSWFKRWEQRWTQTRLRTGSPAADAILYPCGKRWFMGGDGQCHPVRN
jgi:hypothetical protein